MQADGWPVASDFPYRALIRIRYVHEIDLVALDILQRAILDCGRSDLAKKTAVSLTHLSARRALAAAERPQALGEERDLVRLAALKRWAVDRRLQPGPQPWKPSPDPWKPDPTPWEFQKIDLVRTLSTGIAFLAEVLEPEMAQEASHPLHQGLAALSDS